MRSKIILMALSALVLCACSHFKSVFNAPSKQNTCLYLQRRMLFSNTASGQTTQWKVQSERMQLEQAYRDSNCYQIMQKDSSESSKSDVDSKKANSNLPEKN